MWFLFSAMHSVFDLRRTCRWCGHRQMVALKDKDRTVPCGKCGESIRSIDLGK